MSSSRRNVALVAAAAFAVWLQYLGGTTPWHLLVMAVLVVVVGAAGTGWFAVTGLRRQFPLGLLVGGSAAGVVTGLSSRTGPAGAAALVAVVLAVSSAALLRPAHGRVRARDRLAEALREAAAPAVDTAGGTAVHSGVAHLGDTASSPQMSPQILPTRSVDLPRGRRRARRKTTLPMARERRAVL